MEQVKLVGQKARLVVVESVYFQQAAEDPITMGSSFSRQLDSTEQPYRRIFQVGEEWQRLDSGWLAGASLLMIHNQKNPWSANPTEEQLREARAKVLEIGYVIDGGARPRWQVFPGESLRGCPVGLEHIWLRCLKGSTRVVLNLIP